MRSSPARSDWMLKKEERDPESGTASPGTGNDYFGKRYYASSMGRWLSPDLINVTEPASNRTLGNRGGDLLDRQSGSTGPIFSQFGIGQSGPTCLKSDSGQLGRSFPQLRRWDIGTDDSLADWGHGGSICPAIFALKGGGACARSANRSENGRHAPFDCLALTWLSPCRHRTAPWHLGQGEEKKRDRTAIH